MTPAQLLALKWAVNRAASAPQFVQLGPDARKAYRAKLALARQALKTLAPDRVAPATTMAAKVVIEAGFQLHSYRQGTAECIAFNRGVRFTEREAANVKEPTA